MFIIWGSRYAFKKTHSQRYGLCPLCRKQSLLMDFEARKWFTIYFIPIFPISKVHHITSYCNKCKRGYRSAENAKPLKPARTKEQILADGAVDSHEKTVLMRALIELMNLKADTEALEIAEIIEKNFGQEQDAQKLLARFYRSRKEYERAIRFYEAYLNTYPEDKKVLNELADIYIEKRNLWKAENLLMPGGQLIPGISLNTIVRLSKAYVQEGRNERAYELLKALAADSPEYLYKNKSVLKSLRQLEKELHYKKIIVPRPKIQFNSRLLIVPLIILGIAGIITFIQIDNYNNQNLYLNNPFKAEARIYLNDSEIVLMDRQRKKIKLAEGNYDVRAVVGDREFQYQIVLENNFFERFGSNHFYVLNIGNGACLFMEDIYYSTQANPDVEYNYELNVSSFIEYRNIDYAFSKAPETVSISNGNYIIKKKLSIFLPDDPAAVLNALLNNGYDAKKMLEFAENNIYFDPENSELLTSYHLVLYYQNNTKRGIDFYETFLDQQPVLIQIHRFYQNLISITNDQTAIIGRYDNYIRKYPENADYLYLRGRLAQGTECLSYYKKAISLNKNKAYPYHAIGYYHYQAGEFHSAIEYSQRAFELNPDNTDFSDFYYKISFALRDFSSIEKEYRQSYQQDVSHLYDFNQYIQIQILKDNLPAVQAAMNEIEELYRANDYSEISNIMNFRWLDYSIFKNDVSVIKKQIKKIDTQSNVWPQFVLDIIEQNISGIEEYLNSGDSSIYDWILQWLNLIKSGNMNKANEYNSRILDLLDNSPLEDFTLFFNRKQSRPLDFCKSSDLDLNYKRLLALSGAYLYPRFRRSFVQLARKYNVSLYFPFYQVDALAGWIEKLR